MTDHAEIDIRAARAIRAAVGRGVYGRDQPRRRGRRDAKAVEPWVGHLIGRHLGFDTTTQAGCLRACADLKRLIEKGILTAAIKYLECNGRRRQRIVIVPGPNDGKVPGRPRKPKPWEAREAREARVRAEREQAELDDYDEFWC
jgi:hypothetical protein